MSQKNTISRWMLIIDKLKNPCSLDEILNYLDLESEIQDEDYRVTQRTLQRDIKSIYSVFGIDIQYDRARQAYAIVSDDRTERQKRALEALQIYDALKINDRVSDNIILETRRPSGAEHLHGLLHAIENKKEISFEYQKYWEDEIKTRHVRPYALKEFNFRWYLICEDIAKGEIRTFGLDRILDLVIERTSFERSKSFDAKKYFSDCFGIIKPDNQKPQEVILSFTAIQGKYVKSLPLHHSQKVIVDTEAELRISLHLYITYDFIQELLSHGAELEVIKPKSLAKEIKQVSEMVMGYYQK